MVRVYWFCTLILTIPADKTPIPVPNGNALVLCVAANGSELYQLTLFWAFILLKLVGRINEVEFTFVIHTNIFSIAATELYSTAH